MPKGAPDPLKKKLTATLKEMLGERASVELLEQIDPELLKQLGKGKSVPLIAELLVKKVVKLALDPKKVHQWAIELIFDRVDGRAVQGIPAREDGRVIGDRLDDITTEHLNSLAARFAKDAAPELAAPEPAEDMPAGPAAKLLDLSKDKIAGPQAPGGESEMEEATAETGGI